MEIRFCRRCSESIPDADFEAGKAVTVSGRHYHGGCALAQSLSLGGPRSWLTFLLALYAAAVATWLLVTALGPPEPPPVTTAMRAAISEAAASVRTEAARGLQAGLVAARADQERATEETLKTVREELQARLDLLQARLEESDRLVSDHVTAHQRRLEDLEKEVNALSGLLREIKEQAERLEAQRLAAPPTPAPAPPTPQPAEGPPPTPAMPAVPPAPGTSEEVDRWIRRLSDANENIRFSATLELGRLKDLRAVTPLVGVLRGDRDYYVRLGAATALGDLKAVDAVDALVDALDDEDALVRTAANDALQAITEQPFEFVPGMSRSERKKLQRRWLDWFKENETPLRDRLGQPKSS